MSINKWPRNEKIGLAGVIVALIAFVAAMLNPEIRKFVGLENSSASPSVPQAPDLTNTNINPGRNINANKPAILKQTNSNSTANINSNTFPAPNPDLPNETPKDQPSEGPSIATEKAEGFTFELRSCRASGSDIVVTLMITNHRADKTLWLFDDTSINSGGEVYNVDDKRFGGSAPEATFRTGIPIKATLTFRGIAQVVKRVKLLDLHFQEFHVPFPDFEVSD